MAAQSQYEELARQLSAIGAVKRGLARILPAECPSGSAAVLTLLDRHGEMRMSRLAELLAVDMSVTSRHVAHVAERGWIERLPDPGDRRSRILRLTPAGLDMLDELARRTTDMFAQQPRATGPTTTSDSSSRLLARLRDALRRLPGRHRRTDDAPPVHPCRSTKRKYMATTTPDRCAGRPRQARQAAARLRRRAPMTHRQIMEALSGLLLGMFVAILSSTIVSNALPEIITDLGGGQSAYTWVVTAALLSMTATTPLWGKLSDLFSKKLLVQIALVIYVAGSVVAGLSQNTGMLIACRVVQGIGVGGLSALAQIVMAAMISPRERGRYSGYLGATFAVATVGGPLLGGVITDTDWLGWRWCFYVGVPFAIIALIVLQKTLKLPVVKRRGQGRLGGRVLHQRRGLAAAGLGDLRRRQVRLDLLADVRDGRRRGRARRCSSSSSSRRRASRSSRCGCSATAPSRWPRWPRSSSASRCSRAPSSSASTSSWRATSRRRCPAS